MERKPAGGMAIRAVSYVCDCIIQGGKEQLFDEKWLIFGENRRIFIAFYGKWDYISRQFLSRKHAADRRVRLC